MLYISLYNYSEELSSEHSQLRQATSSLHQSRLTGLLVTIAMSEPTSAEHGDVLYDIGKSEEVGRFMKAKRDLVPGEVIFQDQPASITVIFCSYTTVTL